MHALLHARVIESLHPLGPHLENKDSRIEDCNQELLGDGKTTQLPRGVAYPQIVSERVLRRRFCVVLLKDLHADATDPHGSNVSGFISNSTRPLQEHTMREDLRGMRYVCLRNQSLSVWHRCDLHDFNLALSNHQQPCTNTADSHCGGRIRCRLEEFMIALTLNFLSG